MSFTPSDTDFLSAPDQYSLRLSDATTVYSTGFELVYPLDSVTLVGGTSHVVRTQQVCLTWYTGDSSAVTSDLVDVNLLLQNPAGGGAVGESNEEPSLVLVSDLGVINNTGSSCWPLPTAATSQTYYVISIVRVLESGEPEPFVPVYSPQFYLNEVFAVTKPQGCDVHLVNSQGALSSPLTVAWWPGQYWNDTLTVELWSGEEQGQVFDSQLRVSQGSTSVSPHCFTGSNDVCASYLDSPGAFRIRLVVTLSDGTVTEGWSDFFSLTYSSSALVYCPPPSYTLPRSSKDASLTGAELKLRNGQGSARTGNVTAYAQTGEQTDAQSLSISPSFQRSITPSTDFDLIPPTSGNVLGFYSAALSYSSLSKPSPSTPVYTPLPEPVDFTSNETCNVFGSWTVVFGPSCPYYSGFVELYPLSDPPDTYVCCINHLCMYRAICGKPFV